MSNAVESGCGVGWGGTSRVWLCESEECMCGGGAGAVTGAVCYTMRLEGGVGAIWVFEYGGTLCIAAATLVSTTRVGYLSDNTTYTTVCVRMAHTSRLSALSGISQQSCVCAVRALAIYIYLSLSFNHQSFYHSFALRCVPGSMMPSLGPQTWPLL